MNIKLALITLSIGSAVCLTALPVQADAWRITRDKYEDSQKEKQQGKQERDEGKKQPPSKERPRQEQPRRDRDDDRARDRHKISPPDRQPPVRSDRDRDHRDRPPARIDRDRYERPPSGLYERVKRKAQPTTTVKRPRHRIYYRDHIHRDYHYVLGPWYYTRYISPYPYYYYPFGFELEVLPSTYVRFYIGGLAYYYHAGIYYRPYRSGYIVVAAPIGAFVTSLPDGFIAFSIGLATYYYLNNTYYIWDDAREGYVVVEKPKGAEDAIAKATRGRLVVYPNKGQSEDQQAKDRYECHRWAVSESGFDPTLEENEYSPKDNDVYRRALAACLEGRDYTVK